MILRITFLFFFLIFFFSGIGQDRKSIKAFRTVSGIKIDGVLDEVDWIEAVTSSDFIQASPNNGSPSKYKTEIKVIYSNTAIYFGVTCFDHVDSISKNLSQRDNEGNADWLAVIIDPYNKGLSGFGYGVTAAGVQMDAIYFPDGEDINWNAVWSSAISYCEEGWVAEFEIPYSAIRFPNVDVQDWGLNVLRERRTSRERSTWNYVNPAGVSFLAQTGKLEGVTEIEAPLRLSFMPYVSGYLENSTEGNPEGIWSQNYNGGMDLKYGINDAFTLDMTLIPDFGQVQFDRMVFNLSPFEVRYNENRQFFTEGVDMFDSELFYSRRIGGAPIAMYNAFANLSEGETVVGLPSATPIINSTKLSGRTSKGLGVGVINGVTAKTFATISDTLNNTRLVEISPLSNYNVFVLDQNLKNNSSIKLTNASVLRAGHYADANSSELSFNLYDKKQVVNFYGTGAVSQQFSSQNSLGHRVDLNVSKPTGNFTVDLGYNESSETYDPNDLGFVYRNNIRQVNSGANYSIFKPTKYFNEFWSGVNYTHNTLYTQNLFVNQTLGANFGGVLKNFTAVGLWTFVGSKGYDYFEPRKDGYTFILPFTHRYGGWFSTNYAKKFALDANLVMYTMPGTDWKGSYYSLSPRMRMGDKFNLILSSDYYIDYNGLGAALTHNWDVPQVGQSPVFGKRDQETVENNLTIEYIFNNKMGLKLQLRHYWVALSYDDFYELSSNGALMPSLYNGLDSDGLSLHDNTYNAFTIDLVYKWVFSPGSLMSIVWKYGVFNEAGNVDQTYVQNLGNIYDLPYTTSLSLKILYFLDYLKFKKK